MGHEVERVEEVAAQQQGDGHGGHHDGALLRHAVDACLQQFVEPVGHGGLQVRQPVDHDAAGLDQRGAVRLAGECERAEGAQLRHQVVGLEGRLVVGACAVDLLERRLDPLLDQVGDDRRLRDRLLHLRRGRPARGRDGGGGAAQLRHGLHQHRHVVGRGVHQVVGVEVGVQREVRAVGGLPDQRHHGVDVGRVRGERLVAIGLAGRVGGGLHGSQRLGCAEVGAERLLDSLELLHLVVARLAGLRDLGHRLALGLHLQRVQAIGLAEVNQRNRLAQVLHAEPLLGRELDRVGLVLEEVPRQQRHRYQEHQRDDQRLGAEVQRAEQAHTRRPGAVMLEEFPARFARAVNGCAEDGAGGVCGHAAH